MKKQFVLTVGIIVALAIVMMSFASAPVRAQGPATPAADACGTVIRQWEFDIQVDQADGDPFSWWVSTAWDGVNAQTRFVALGETMFAIDYQKSHIVGTSYRIEAADLAAATCAANEIALKIGGSPYKFFVGTAQPLTGWSNIPPTGWKMRITQYQEEAIDPGGSYSEVQFKVTAPRSYTVNSGAWFYVQLWNPTIKNKATHVVLAPGWKLTFPMGYQGTGWLWVAGDDGDLAEFFKRSAQASNEVFLRDKKPVITKLWCGPKGEGPESWEPTMPDGWSCTANSS